VREKGKGCLTRKGGGKSAIEGRPGTVEPGDLKKRADLEQPIAPSPFKEKRGQTAAREARKPRETNQ